MNKNQLFYKKWALIRQKGRLFYTLSRGLLFWIIIYAAWIVTTLIFDRNKFNGDAFQNRFIYWGLLYLLLGLGTSNNSWKAKENKYAVLKKYLSNQIF